MLLSSGAGGREPVARLFVWQICGSTWLALSSLCFVDILGEYLLASSDLSAFAGCLASLCCPVLPPLFACLCHVACLAGLLPCVLLIADPVVLVLVVLLVVAVALVDFLALFTFILLLLVLLLLPPVWAIFLS